PFGPGTGPGGARRGGQGRPPACGAPLEKTEFARAGHRLCPGGDAELAEDRTCVRLDGVEGDVELGGDLALGEPAREGAEDGDLALGELPERCASSVAAGGSQAKRFLGLHDTLEARTGIGKRLEHVAGACEQAAGCRW